jgi:hypothetical protein
MGGTVTALAIIGAIHVAAYAVIGFSLTFTLFVNWTARQYKLKAEMIRIYRAMLEERFAKRERK